MGEGRKWAGAQGEQEPECGRQWSELGGQHGSPHGVRNRMDGRRSLGAFGDGGVVSGSRPAPQALLSPFLCVHPLSCLWLILPGLFKSCLGTGALEGAGRPSPPPWLPLLRPAGYRLYWKSRTPGLESVPLGVRCKSGRGGSHDPWGGGSRLCLDMECLNASFSVSWWGEVCLFRLFGAQGIPRNL